MILADARRAEERNRRPVDLVDLGEPGAELVRDLRHGVVGVGLLGVEDAPVVDHQKSRGTCVCSIPNTSSAASPKYRSAITMRCHGSTR